MLIPCLWTTLPWIVLGQTYYMSFIFNNYGFGVKPSFIEAPNLGLPGTKKPPKRVEDTLELSSMDQSRGSGRNEIPTVEVDDDSSESDGFDFGITSTKIPTKRSTLRPTNTTKTQRPSTAQGASRTTATSKATGTPTISKTPGTIETIGITETLESADTLETPEEITTESAVVAYTEESSLKTPDSDRPESGKTEVKCKTLGPGDGSTIPPGTIAPRAWPPVTPHPPEFFKYPQADCHEEMDLHEVFGISLVRDRGLATKVLCQFQNSWGGPWLLMTRVELPVRIHMRHWFLGYVTEDYKDMNINFFALAHIMNNMRTAMLILGQDEHDQLVYNLYDDVVISSFNDIFMMRKAELVEANATDMLFLSVGKTLSSYAGRNRTCPLQVLGSWWGSSVRQDMNQGFSCVFPRERNASRPGYMAIFIKPSLFRNNNTALYNTVITTRRPWEITVNVDLMEDVKNNKTEYNIRRRQQFRSNKRAVSEEFDRRRKIFNAIAEVQRLEVEMRRGR
ncbi:uncharacterized protein [Drosophila kikkawai]|uniref:Uncharacterized protein n=1 Tax=Drosophila kikkawai TaxID=30033 RepID=A0ABM3C606_DROKI